MSGTNIRFCQECNNLLYPKEDKPRRVLMYACRNCPYAIETDNPCVFRRELKVALIESAGTTQDLHTDPTLPRTYNVTCTKCGNRGAVYYQDQSKRTETKMILFFFCLHCHKPFRDPRLEAREHGNRDEAMDEQEVEEA